jgi:hypothetical protein
LSEQAAAYEAQFVRALGATAGSYATAEAANAAAMDTFVQSLLQDTLNAINAPTNLLFGTPLIGDGTNGAPGTGQPGGSGGILWGNGGGPGVDGDSGSLLGTSGSPGSGGTHGIGGGGGGGSVGHFNSGSATGGNGGNGG